RYIPVGHAEIAPYHDPQILFRYLIPGQVTGHQRHDLETPKCAEKTMRMNPSFFDGTEILLDHAAEVLPSGVVGHCVKTSKRFDNPLKNIHEPLLPFYHGFP